MNGARSDESRLIEEICEKQVLPCVFALLPLRIQKGVQRHFRGMKPKCPSCHTSKHVQFRYFNNKDKSCTLQPRYRCNNDECHGQLHEVFPSTNSSSSDSSRKKSILFTYNGSLKTRQKSPSSSSLRSKPRVSGRFKPSSPATRSDAASLCQSDQLSDSSRPQLERCDRMEYESDLFFAPSYGAQWQNTSGDASTSHHNWPWMRAYDDQSHTGPEYIDRHHYGEAGYQSLTGPPEYLDSHHYGEAGYHQCLTGPPEYIEGHHFWEAGARVTKQESSFRFDEDADGHLYYWDGAHVYDEPWHLLPYLAHGNGDIQQNSGNYENTDIPPGDEVNANQLPDLDLTYFLIQEQQDLNGGQE